MVRSLNDSVEIAAPPARVWEWLTHLAEHYPSWHPGHVGAAWVRGEPNAVGSVLRAVEFLGRTREILRFELTAVEPPRLFHYRMLGPVAWLLPGGAFEIVPVGEGARFTATIDYRFGGLTERLFRRRMRLLLHHMQEEGVNLKRLLEPGR